MDKENKAVRCAIYTRKSHEEGLEQDFNSLDAQRESGENYIASQKTRGWICLPERYDDGGFSGGNTNRPALKKLLEDIASGKVDVVVVYKIDRLSRSICDFAELSKTFDKFGASFVAVTQAAIKELLERQTGNAAIEDCIQNLSGNLNVLDDNCDDLQTFLARFVETRQNINNFFRATNEELSEISVQIEKIAPKDGSENPAELERKKREKDNERDGLIAAISRDEGELEKREKLKKAYEDKLTQASKLDEKCRLATRRFEASKNVGNALLKLNEILVSKVKDSVSEEIKNMLASVTDSYLHGEVTQDFELKTFKRDDGVLVPIATSTGQQQVTSLAFIASLVKIAKKNMDNKTSNFLRGGEFPLVMDAPFNNVDSIYGPKIAEVLPQATPQVILMTNPQQWHGVIESVLRPFVGSEYLIVKNSNSVEQAASVRLPSGEKDLNKQIDGIQYSVIEEA